MGRIIRMPIHSMEIKLEGDGTGTIMSDLYRDPHYSSNEKWRASVDAIESLVLGHALFGINTASPMYVKGVKLALEATSVLVE